MKKPNLADYGIAQPKIDAAKASKAKSEDIRNKVLLTLFSIVILAVIIKIYLIEHNILFAILVGFFVGGFIGMFVTMVGTLLWEGIWNSANPEHRDVLKRYKKYETDLREFSAWRQRLLEVFWNNLSGRQFEIELGKIFSQLGYSVEVTPYARDMGVDIVLKKSGTTTLIQCKRSGQPVGVAKARELYGVLQDMKGDKAILACTGGFTQGARDFIAGKPIKLLGLQEIISMQKSLGEDKDDPTTPLSATS